MSNENDIGLTIDTGPVEKGVNKSIKELDRLIKFLGSFERSLVSVKNATAESLQGTLAIQSKHNKSMIAKFEELREEQLMALQAGNVGTVDLTRKQNKALQDLYDARKAIVGKMTVEELEMWKGLNVSLGKLEQARLSERKAAQKTEAASAAAHMKEMQRQTAQGLAAQRSFATEAAKLYKTLSSGPSSLAYQYKKDTETALEALRKFYTVEATIRENAGKQASAVGSPLSSVRKNVELDSTAVLASMEKFYSMAQRFDAIRGAVGSPISRARRNTEEDSAVILAEMNRFYSAAQRITENFGRQTAAVGGPLSSVRKSVELDSKAILADMRKFYSDQERIMRNIQNTKNGMSANTGVGRRSAGLDEQDAVRNAAMAQMRQMYLEAGAKSGYNGTSEEMAKISKEAPRAAAAMRALGGDMNYAHSMARGLASGFGLLWLTWGSLAPLFVGAALSNGFVQTAKTGMDVAHTFAIIENVGNNTKQEVEALHAQLLDMGRTGPFGPREIADAMKVLSLAGLDANKILAVTKDVLNFSVAGTTDLKTAAETLMTVSTAFGLGANGFARVSDVISKAAATSLTSVENFSNAMKTASVINAQYEVSLEDTATAIAAMSQLGIQGTAAGTALRNMYADLSGRSTQVAKVLKSQNIEMRDSTGAMRPMIEIVGELSNKLKSLGGISQKNLLQSILSERGAKGMIELLRLVETEGVGNLSNALEKMRSEIADSAGFAAITAAKMAQSTKMQFESVKAALGTAMDQAYQAMAPQLALIFDSLRKTFASPEFVNGLATMVSGVATLTQVLVENAKVIGVAFAAYATLATAKAAAVAMSTLFATRLTAEAAAKGTAAAATMTLARAETAAGAAKGGALLGLARIIPGLNVAVGLATAGWLAYSFARDKSNKADADGSALYTNNVVKDLTDQAVRLEKILVLRKQGLTLTAAQQQLENDKAKATQLSPGQSRIAEAKEKELEAITKLQRMEKEYARFSAVDTKRQIDEQKKRVAARSSVVDFEIKSQAAQAAAIDNAGSRVSAAQRANDALTEAETKVKFGKGAAFGAGKFEAAGLANATKATNTYTSAVVSNAAAIDKQTNAELAAAKTRYDNATAISNAKNDAKLVSDGENYAQLITLTEAYERAQLEAHRKGNEALVVEEARVQAALKAEAEKDISNSKLSGAELAEFRVERIKSMNEKAQAEAEKHKASIAQNEAQILAIQTASDQRKETEHIKHLGRMKAAEKQAADYIKEIRAKRAADFEKDALDNQFSGVNENSPATAKAAKAAAYAGYEAAQAHRAEIERLTVALGIAKTAYEDLRKAATGATDPATKTELETAAKRYGDEMAAAEQQLQNVKEESSKDVAIAAARAYSKEMKSAQQQLVDGISSAIITGLFEGGKAGKKALRDLVVAELQKPIKLYVNAFVNTLMNGMIGQGGFSWSDLASAYSASAGGGAAAGGTAVVGASGAVYTEAAGGGSSAGGAAMGYMTYAALIAAAVMIAENLYSKGYNRVALGEGGSETVRAGKYTNYTSDPSVQKSWMNYGIMNLMSKDMRYLADKLGMSKKWADILSGTTRMATLIGRKLTAYGMQADISGGNVNVSGFAKYKGGVFRSNKTVPIDIDPRDAEMLRLQIEAVKGSARGMAAAMGYSTEAIDNYNGTLRVNFKNAKDSAEIAKRMDEAMTDLQYAMLNAAAGGKLTKEAFTTMMAEAKAAMESVGISAQGMTDILVAGMLGKLSGEEVGNQLADMIVGGIYTAIAQNYAGMIAEAFMGQIITPIFTAIMAGVPISQAVSAAAIDNVVNMATQAAEALNAIFNDPAFIAAMEQIDVAIRSISFSAASIETPQFDYSTNVSDVNDAEKERYELETRLLNLLGNTTRLRERELAGIDATNQALQQQIWTLEDAKDAMDKAMEALSRAIEAEKDVVNTQLEAARETENLLNEVFDTLRQNIRELRGEVADGVRMQAADGRNFIANALATQSVTDPEKLNDAISSVRDALDSADYATSADRTRAYFEFSNQLQELSDLIQPQLSAVEQNIQLLEDQLVILDNQLKISQAQLDALNGIDTSTKTATEAVLALNTAMAAYTAAVAAGNNVPTSAGAPPASSSGGGGGGGGGGGWESGGGSSGEWTAQGYAEKNPDIVANYEQNKGADWWPADLNSWDAYARWHWEGDGQREGRQYAKGGYYPGGLALVGEDGPELINFRNPGQVYTADQTRDYQDVAVNGSGAEAYLAAMVQELREAHRLNYALAASNAKILGVLRRVTKDGVSVNVSTEEPISTVSV